MAERKQAITPANIKYLLTVYELSGNGSGVKSSRIASVLGVTKPSVHTMINSLCEHGLARKDSYGSVRFTKCGYEFAARYRLYYEKIVTFFSIVISEESNRHSAAYAILASLPEDAVKSMCKKIIFDDKQNSTVTETHQSR